jgi:hypothetical protein
VTHNAEKYQTKPDSTEPSCNGKEYSPCFGNSSLFSLELNRLARGSLLYVVPRYIYFKTVEQVLFIVTLIITELADVLVTIWTCIREDFGSNLGWYTVYADINL